MNLNNFYEEILGLSPPWSIFSMQLDSKEKSVSIHLSHAEKTNFGCPICDKPCPVYDHGQARTWRHLDTCDHYTYLHASLPRVCCEDCGVHTIKPPWSDCKSRFTLQFESYIIDVLGQTQVVSCSALLLRLAPHQVQYVRDKAVTRGLSRRAEKDNYRVAHVCIDEKSFRKGQHYVTLFYDGHTGAILEVVEHRTIASTTLGIIKLREFVDLQEVKVVTMDMWEAFKSSVQSCIPKAVIVHDRFHLAQYLNKAVDIVRRAENKRLVKQEDERLKKTKYLWLKNPENLKETQEDTLNELLEDESLKTVQAYQAKEIFKHFFNCADKAAAKVFFSDWFEKVIQSELAPLIKVGKMFKKHLNKMLNYFEYRVSNAMAECKNTSVQQIKCKARGFKSAKAFRTSILFYFGDLDLYP